MSDLVAEFLKSATTIQLIATAVIVWFFYTRIDKKLEKSEARLLDRINSSENELKSMLSKSENELKSMHSKSENELKNVLSKSEYELKDGIKTLADKVEDVDRRLCRIEGSLATHGHCLFNQAQPDKKAG